MMAARTDLTDTMIVRDGAPLYMRAIRINTPLCLQCHGAREDLARYTGEATGFGEPPAQPTHEEDDGDREEFVHCAEHASPLRLGCAQLRTSSGATQGSGGRAAS